MITTTLKTVRAGILNIEGDPPLPRNEPVKRDSLHLNKLKLEKANSTRSGPLINITLS